MNRYTTLERNRYFEVLGGLNVENHGDNKVAMLSELDMSSAQALRDAVGNAAGVKPSYTAIVAKAISIALREHPYANRISVERPFWKRILQLQDVDITVAVERDRPGIEQAVFAERSEILTNWIWSILPRNCKAWRRPRRTPMTAGGC